jgi:uncharacterized membrane protein/acyl-CoA synthetase (AMP-forming)/AMP-acid ligase II/3-hydroxymyristoyl/3-hydroxydecanoyl-(acyl carrier protein) dehydratase
MRRILHVLFYVVVAAYPLLMFCFLVVFKIPLRFLSLFVIFIALLYFLGITSAGKKKKPGTLILNAVLLLGIGLLCFVTNSAVILKLYPVLINGIFLIFFGSTLFFPPVMIFRFATLQDKSIRGSLAEKRIERYCRKVTVIWCCFFILNGAAALVTVLGNSDVLWSVYNGGISYILIGTLFAGEFIVRKMTDKKMPKAYPLSGFTPASRPPGAVVCYEGAYSGGTFKTWRDFLDDTAKLRAVIRGGNSGAWILHVEDCWYFLCAFTALLQCKKQIHLTANISPSYIAEIRTGEMAFLTDRNAPDSLFIPGLLASAPPPPPAEVPPPIDAGETVIMMYTSGTTGRPKVVRQRLTELEMDNRFVLSRWGEEFLKRRLCSTVSQHHIYGILYSILLPFTAGVPFRRGRVEFPEEFERLTGDSYMIITVPAFLKRAVETREAPFSLTDPWIFTSGGALAPDTADKTNSIFKFWPVEIYGSTETSGIAFRQSKNGLEWTPFDNAEIGKSADGCLVIRSPYIKDPGGFETGDLVDILEDGRFLLKGRADSIVKIEEKRISLPEVESRLVQSGLVSDAVVVAMEDRRQYLAAALVLNEQGKEKFAGREKYEINRYFSDYALQFFENVVIPKKWRYVDALPLDSQGKKKKQDIQALFLPLKGDILARHGIKDEKVLERTENKVLLELFIPPESDYFDDHFPKLKVLPAVAQFEMIMRLGDKYFGTGLHVVRLKRIKFSSLIRPGVRVRMELTYKKEKNSVSFVLTSLDGSTVFSSGAVNLGGRGGE